MKTESVSEHSEKTKVTENVTTPKSDSAGKTPSSGEKVGASGTPGKPKSKRRLAANFNFGGSS